MFLGMFCYVFRCFFGMFLNRFFDVEVLLFKSANLHETPVFYDILAMSVFFPFVKNDQTMH